MSVVSAKCPNCGASIQLDNEKEEGFCSYCGSKLKVQEAVSIIKIDNSKNLQNYISLAENALKSGNGEEGYKYANKSLEIDATNGRAWFLKMQALDFLGTLKDIKINEIITAGKNAIKFSLDSEITDIVHTFFLNKSISCLNFCYNLISDTKNIKNLYQANCSVSAFSASGKTGDFDSQYVTKIEIIANSVVKLKAEVPIDKIASNERYMKKVEKIADGYIRYSEALNDRYNIYGNHLLDSAIEARRNILNQLKEGLPDDKKQNIQGERINNNQSSGCYIATAVYGSYDAPEVLILRHFRDTVLIKHYFGRLFIKIYYLLSPPIAEKLKNAKHMNCVVKNILDKCVIHLINSSLIKH
jgi:DNA-directed RNA polymerase subunit RPC12/RpoP